MTRSPEIALLSRDRTVTALPLQICLFDMDYQLPVQVRDELLGVTQGGDLDVTSLFASACRCL